MAEGIAEQYGDSYRLKKNVTKVMKFVAYSYVVHTNEWGFRDQETGLKALDDKRFAVFLGASDVFGNGVNYEDSFVGIFAQEASKRGLGVLNLAIGGHYFLDQESLLKDFMRDTGLTPATIFHCVNALHIPKFDRRNTNIFVKNGYILNKRNWQFSYLRLIAGNMSSAFCFVRDGIRRIQERYLSDEITEKSPEFLQVYDRKNDIRSPERIKQFLNYLEGFEAFCNERAIELVYVYLPLSDSFRLREMVEHMKLDPEAYDATFYEDLIRAHCETKGIRLVNPRPLLEYLYENGEELRFKLDPHFNSLGNKVIGDHLVGEVFSKTALQLD